MDETQKQIITDQLKETANRFVHKTYRGTEIWAASEDWFLESWGRDTFISLRGLLLSTKKFAEAREVFRSFAQYEQKGLIPNRIKNDSIEYNTVDASLWFIHALKAYFESAQDWNFVKEMMPTVRNIVHGYEHGTEYKRHGAVHRVFMDEDGLIMSPPQATWMDADPSGQGLDIITPRNGKCVDINTLWYGALVFVAALEKRMRKSARSEWLLMLAKRVKKNINLKFWNKEEKCLLDVIEGDPHRGALRPNQIFAISHGGDLLSSTRQKQVFQSVKNDLLTPYGLRTLSPRDSHFVGQYHTHDPMDIKDRAYHQGTVWPWLIGAYIDALVVVRTVQRKYDFAIKQEIESVLQPLVDFCLSSENKSLPEVFSGSEPHEAGGTKSQAWSVAEVLRVIDTYLA